MIDLTKVGQARPKGWMWPAGRKMPRSALGCPFSGQDVLTCPLQPESDTVKECKQLTCTKDKKWHQH